MDALIVAPSRSDNSLGRALSLAEAFQHLGGVRVLAYDDGPLWQGARDSSLKVASFTAPEQIADAITAASPAVVLTVKPFRRSLHWTVNVLRSSPRGGPRPTFVADLDDFDAAIHAAWHRELAPVDRARSLVRSDLSPLRIRSRIRFLVPAADVLTISSWALRSRFPAFRGPEIRVPHPRAGRPYQPPVASDRLRVGFLGTPVGYKGVDTIARLVSMRADTELHVLAGTEAAFGTVDRDRLVVHAHHGAETLEAAFRHVDVVLLPQDRSMPAARYQLPAKLVDALRFGRPVVATDTPPIRELAGPSVLLVPSWEPLDLALEALDTLAARGRRESLGRHGAEGWAASFASDALARQLSATLRNAGAARPLRAQKFFSRRDSA